MLPRRPRTTRRRSESGASAVEFALILPVFVLIIAAILDFGFIFAQQVQLNNAARDAARQAVVKNLAGTAITCTETVSKARAGSQTVGISGAETAKVGVRVERADTANSCYAPPSGSVTSSTTPCTGAGSTPANNPLTVTLTYTSTAPLPLPYLNSKVLTAQGVFQCEYK
ncbi:Flp pilus assembly protein TadG [Pedococcus dokdonensis]|uniref:Flp pilus assembly protein TadG n=1 Tax=Pedococcus dokdonensis TaxID=443156 RepID=A0A1H0RA28_9MICO|nr:TadE/TadG family type IV pilus assembly protein [Pedococcus dokdonensis]SDP26321.1 Flp pilus assembly protein TadG [Pedococcus dokdonensis]